MVSRRFLTAIAIISTAAAFFLLGDFHARAGDAVDRAEYDAKLDAIRAEVHSQIGRDRSATAAEVHSQSARDGRAAVVPAGTAGDAHAATEPGPPSEASRTRMVAEIK